MKYSPRSRHWQPMLALVVLLAGATALVACSPSSNVGAPVPDSVIPDGLKDCGFYGITTGSGTKIHIVRCPNSATSAATNGKSPVYSATIDETGPGLPAGASSANGYISDEDRRRATHEAHMAVIDANIKRLELQAAELRAKQGN
jgi:hypothetical protein